MTIYKGTTLAEQRCDTSHGELEGRCVCSFCYDICTLVCLRVGFSSSLFFGSIWDGGLVAHHYTLQFVDCDTVCIHSHPNYFWDFSLPGRCVSH